MRVKQYSPFVIDFKLLEKGNLRQRSRLALVWRNLKSYDNINRPITVKSAAKRKAPPRVQSSIAYDTKTFRGGSV